MFSLIYFSSLLWNFSSLWVSLDFVGQYHKSDTPRNSWLLSNSFKKNYSWSSLFENCLKMQNHWLKFICNPQNNTCSTFSHLQAWPVQGKFKSSFTCMFPAEVKQGDTLPSYFCSYTINKCVLFTVYFVPHFSHFCAFCWFQFLKWPPNTVLNCSPMFLSSRRNMCLMEKIHVVK